MQSIPFEVMRHVEVEYLSAQDILNLCSTSKEYQEICRDNNLWIYLLRRDYQTFYTGKNAKEEYFYIKYIHDISDIPLSKVVQLSEKYKIGFAQVEMFLDLLGYQRKGTKFDSGDTYELSNLPALDAYNEMEQNLKNANDGTWWHDQAMGITTSVSFFEKKDRKKAREMLQELLPQVWKISEKNVEIPFSNFAEIYDFYAGQDSFWDGFIAHIQEYLDSLPEDIPDPESFETKTGALQLLDQMKNQIYW